MKRFMAVTALMAASTTSAFALDQPVFCGDLAIRLTMASMVARRVDSRTSYDDQLLVPISKGDATPEEKELLIKVIDYAWAARNEDSVRNIGLDYFKACMNWNLNPTPKKPKVVQR